MTKGGGVGLHQDLVFALKASYRDVWEHLVFVLVSVFSISQKSRRNLDSISAFSNILSKLSFCISYNFQFFGVFSPIVPVFFPVYLGSGDNRALTQSSFTHVTTNTWPHSEVFGVFQKKLSMKKCIPPGQITFWKYNGKSTFSLF